MTPEQIKAKVTSVFASMGSTITIRRITSKGTFNPITGQYTGRTVTDRNFVGLIGGRTYRLMADTLVSSAEYVVYLDSNAEAIPDTSDKMMINNDEVAIMRVDELKFQDTVLAYSLVLDR